VAISTSGSGEGPGWVTAPGYSTAPFSSSRPITLRYDKSSAGWITPLSGPISSFLGPHPTRGAAVRPSGQRAGASPPCGAICVMSVWDSGASVVWSGAVVPDLGRALVEIECTGWWQGRAPQRIRHWLGPGPRRHRRWSTGRESQTFEDASSDARIRDGGQDSHATATAGTAQCVYLEDPLQQLGPGMAPVRAQAGVRRRGGCARRWVACRRGGYRAGPVDVRSDRGRSRWRRSGLGPDSRPIFVRCPRFMPSLAGMVLPMIRGCRPRWRSGRLHRRTRHHPISPTGAGGEQAVIPHLMGPWGRDERREALQ
jgi:hypothetical protein